MAVLHHWPGLVGVLCLLVPGVFREADAQARGPLAVAGHSCSDTQRAAARSVTHPTRDTQPPRLTTHNRPPASVELPKGVPQAATLQWVVDTTGEIDPCSIRVLASTSDTWTQAVLSTILGYHFVPARRHHRNIRVMVQQTFTANQ